MPGHLAKYGLRLIRNGYRIIPIPLGGKFPREKQWQKIEATPDLLVRWLRNGHANSGVGVITGHVIGADLDIRHAEMAIETENDFLFWLGEAPVRIGHAPKRMLIFRTETPFPKFSSLKFVDENGQENQVEILGTDRQFVSNHIHPETGKPYYYIDGYDLTQVAACDLIVVTEEMLRERIARFEQRAIERGWTVIGSDIEPAPSMAAGSEPDDDELDLDAEKRQPLGLEEDELERLVMSIPNHGLIPHDVGRDRSQLGWLEMMFAIHHETDGSEFGKELAIRWTESGGFDATDLDSKRWNSFGKDIRQSRRPLTARYIKKWARIEKERKDSRPEIRVRAGELHIMTTEAENALIAQEAPLYSRGQAIVRPVVEEVPASKDRRTKVARLVTVSDAGLRDYLSRHIKWARFDARAKKDVYVDPPNTIAPTLLSRDGEWKLNPLAGVITTPTLRPDGSLLTEAGYDPATRLLLLQPPSIPDIPNKPTKDDAVRSGKLLDHLLNEFPFVSPASRAVALSGLITPVVRGALALAPMHVYRAPAAGSGKTYLVDLASGIAIGRICPVVTAGKTEEETEKRLGADLMTGQSIVLIDNLNGDLYGEHLCQVVERPFVKVRILGRSEMVTIENQACFFATGNNITIRNDMLRRCVLCTLDPDVERPELRTFKDKPFERILAHRGRYIAAALTAVRAYMEAGQPGKLKSPASFDDWSAHVRSMLVWLGYADPYDTVEAARSDDPDLARTKRILHAWRGAFGFDNPKFVSELIAVSGGDISNTAGDEDFNLSQALAELARDGHGVSARQLGSWLRRKNGAIFDGLKIESSIDAHTKLYRYWLSDHDEL